MAEAVVTEALAEREHLVQKESAKEAEDGAGNDESSEGVALLGKRSRFDEEKEATDELKKLWEPATTDLEWKQTAAVERTITMVYAQIESMIHQGLEAYHGWEIMSRDLVHAKEEIETKDRDIKRLRTFEEQSRTTVSVSMTTNRMHHYSSTCNLLLTFSTFPLFRTSCEPWKHLNQTPGMLHVLFRWKPDFEPISVFCARKRMKHSLILMNTSAKLLCWKKNFD